MKRTLAFFSFFLLFSAISGLSILVTYGLTKASSTVSALLAGAFSFLATKLYDSWRESQSRLYEKKREAYHGLISPYLRVLLQSKAGVEVELPKDVIQEAMTNVFGAIFYASDNVLRAYGKLRTVGQESPDETLYQLCKLLKEIRKDLGHNFSTLDEVDVLKLFVNLDVEDELRYRAAFAYYKR